MRFESGGPNDGLLLTQSDVYQLTLPFLLKS